MLEDYTKLAKGLNVSMPKTNTHNQDVINYYNGMRAEYRLLWRNRHNLGLHFGYYDAAHRGHDEAVLNLNAQLAHLVKITKDDYILDAGCGVGGSSIWLAQNIDSRATGVNITPRQVERAAQNALARGVSDKADFIVADFAKIPFGDESFTVFWGVESIVHADDKQAVLNEAFRLLASGGRLVIAEFLLLEKQLSATHQRLLQEWLDGWSMPGLETDTSYRAMLKKSGFKSIKLTDWTQHVLPSLRRLDRFARLFARIAPFMSALGLANKEQLRNLSAVTAQMKLLDAGVWRYKVVTAVKP
jgi:tocopherol O-methyltransferase